jgi:hypothetical protein
VLEAKRLAPDHKPLLPEILLEPKAWVSLKNDIADIDCHQIARVGNDVDLREDIPNIIEPVDRDLRTLRNLLKNGVCGAMEA